MPRFRFAFYRVTTTIAKHLVSLIVFYSGIWAFVRKIRLGTGKGRIVILAYHGINNGPHELNLFLTPRVFFKQMRFLREHYSVISLSAAEALVRNDRCLHEDHIVITFDDGYKDNYLFALPVLAELGLPATIFLTTEPIDAGFPPFAYALILAFSVTDNANLDLSRYGLRKYHVHDHASKAFTISDIDVKAKVLSKSERMLLLDEILSQLGLTRTHPVFQDKMLSWDEIRKMRKSRIEFGAHTITHPVLGRLTQSEIRHEVLGSKTKIEEQLGERVTTFAYPYGGKADVSLTAINVVKECGFSSAVVLYEKKRLPLNPHALGRKMVSQEMSIGTTGDFSKAIFACELDGLFDPLRRVVADNTSCATCI